MLINLAMKLNDKYRKSVVIACRTSYLDYCTFNIFLGKQLVIQGAIQLHSMLQRTGGITVTKKKNGCANPKAVISACDFNVCYKKDLLFHG